jgi:transposase
MLHGCACSYAYEIDEKILVNIAHLEMHYGSLLRCPNCYGECTRYDRRKNTSHHLATRDYKTLHTVKVPRVNCQEHGFHEVDVSWAPSRRTHDEIRIARSLIVEGVCSSSGRMSSKPELDDCQRDLGTNGGKSRGRSPCKRNSF